MSAIIFIENQPPRIVAVNVTSHAQTLRLHIIRRRHHGFLHGIIAAVRSPSLNFQPRHPLDTILRPCGRASWSADPIT